MYEDRLIEMFSKAINDEYTSVIIYTKMASFLRGVDAMPIAKELLEHADEEHIHAKKIVDYVSKHGLESELEYCVDFEEINNCPQDLQGVVEKTQDLEQEAIEHYRKMAECAKGQNDIETYHFVKGLMEDEIEHFDDIAAYTQETRGFLTGVGAVPINDEIAEDKYSDIINILRNR